MFESVNLYNSIRRLRSSIFYVNIFHSMVQQFLTISYCAWERKKCRRLFALIFQVGLDIFGNLSLNMQSPNLHIRNNANLICLAKLWRSVINYTLMEVYIKGKWHALLCIICKSVNTSRCWVWNEGINRMNKSELVNESVIYKI